MVAEAIMKQVQQEFDFLEEDVQVLGIILYGSQATGDATPHAAILIFA